MPGNFISDHQIQDALHINLMLAWRYHLKFPHVPKDEFVSVGYVAIAECLNAWKKKRTVKQNFYGYMKVWIQSRYRDYLRKEHKREQLTLTISRMYRNFRYISIVRDEEERNIWLETEM